MKLLIDIDDELYKGIERRDGSLETEYVCDELMKAVDNGTVLPKGHGRLIDADAVTKSSQVFKESFVVNTVNGVSTGVACLAPTILEADKGVANENTT